MTFNDVLNKKRYKKELTKQEISYVIDEYNKGIIKDCQMSALIMAMTINGMTRKETIYLTDAMIKSGKIIDLSKVGGIVVDKNSTGALGDKVTLVLSPLLASLDINIAKISGKGFDYTGGSIDKLESIPNFSSKMDKKKFIDQVKNLNIAIIDQMDEIAPVDKKLYKIRSLTSTIDCIPLIAASIMSKKIACGSDFIVIDIKVGEGTIIKTLEQAKILSSLMINIGKSYKKPTICFITSMDQPLGYNIGNSLEIEEVISTLKGNGAPDLMEVVITIGSIIVGAAKKISNEDARNLLFKQINNGEALKKFKAFIKKQGGKLEQLTSSSKVFSIKSETSGYINSIDMIKLNDIAKKIGIIRSKIDDNIDYSVGIVLNKKLGDYVEKEEELLQVYLNNKDISVQELLSCFKIEKELKEMPNLIIEIMK